MNDKHKAPEGFPDDAALLAYLEGQADPEAQAAIEAALADSAFLREAMEGLSQAGDPALLKASKQALQARLQKQIPKRRTALSPAQVLLREHWIWLAVALVLILGGLGYWVLHQYISR